MTIHISPKKASLLRLLRQFMEIWSKTEQPHKSLLQLDLQI